MRTGYRRFLIFLFLFIGTFAFSQSEFKIPRAPKKIYPVNDYAKILTDNQKDSLNQKLISYSDSTSTEILVCIVKTLRGDEINYVAARWGEKWKIGQKDKDNGIILLIAVQDHKLSIQNGRGTEDAMTDFISEKIIRDYMIPYLKKDDYYGAINEGTDRIIEVLQGKFEKESVATKEEVVSPVNSAKREISGFFIIGILLCALICLLFFLVLLFIVLISKPKSIAYSRNGKFNFNDLPKVENTNYSSSNYKIAKKEKSKPSKKPDYDGFWNIKSTNLNSVKDSSNSSSSSSSSSSDFKGFGGGGSFGGGGASGSW